MACSKLKSLNLSVVLIERYFNLVYLEYGTLFPEDASWKEVEKTPSLNGLTRTLQEVPSILFKIADLFEDARVEELVKKCERLRLNSGNIHSRFMETITTLLDDGLSWGKVVVFFSFSVSFAIYLCTNEMSHLAARVCVWAAQILEDRLEPWVNQNGGWDSLIAYGKDLLSHKNGTKQQAEAVKRFGQASLMLGAFALAAYTIKQVFS